MRHVVYFIAFIFFTSTFISQAEELHTVKIQPGPVEGKDTLFGTTYYQNGTSSADFMTIGGWGDFYYSFIEFNLSEIPNEAEIHDATLNLFHHKDGGTGNNGRLLRITEPWDEDLVSLDNNPATVDYGDAWSYVPPTLHWWSKDVTSEVKTWHDGTYPNYGLKIIGEGNSNNQGRRFYTSDYMLDPTLRPYLEITYTLPGEEDEETVEGGVERFQQYISGLVSKVQQNSYSAQVKNILGFFETGKFTAALNQLNVLLKKVQTDAKQGELSSEVAENMTETVATMEEIVVAAEKAAEGVPLMTQIASPYPPESAEWADDIYGDGTPDWCGSTIAGCGCAVTSLSMLGKNYGITKGYDGSDVNPGNMNAWLQANNGYTEINTIRWYYGLQYLSDTFGHSRLQLDALNSTNMNQITAAVASGAPGIAFKKSKGHYFVLADVLADGSFAINDPFWYLTKTLSDAKDVANHVQNYGGSFDQANLYSHSNASRPFPRWVEIQLGSPAELLLTDSKGRRTGYDAVTGQVLTEIPGSTYAQAAGPATADELGDDVHLPKVLAVTSPEDDVFSLEVIGTGVGAYTLSVDTGGGYGDSEIGAIEDTITPGKVDSYVIDVPVRQSSDRAVARLRELADAKEALQPVVAERLREVAEQLATRNVAAVAVDIADALE